MATTRRTKAATAKKAVAKKAVAKPEETEEEAASRRGRSSDLGKYELFAQWAEQEHGYEVSPEDAQFTILNYKHFQSSDMNKEYNEEKAAEREEARAEREKAAEERAAKREAAEAAEESLPPRRRRRRRRQLVADGVLPPRWMPTSKPL